MPDNTELLRLVDQYRAALLRRDAAALQRLTGAYTRMYGRLKDKIDLLAAELEKGPLTQGQLMRSVRYKQLMGQIEQELTGYQVILKDEIATVSEAAIANAGNDAARLVRMMAGQAGINVPWNRLPKETVKTLLGFLSEDGPLYARIEKLAGTHAASVADKIIEGVGLGKNPRVIASLIRDELGGGLTDALRMTRTVQIYSYRESSRASYLANSEVVDGWVWHSARDGRTCGACLAMDGSLHGLDEKLDGHYNCRCAMIPVVVGMPNPVEQTGEQWFSRQPEAVQRETLGKSKYDAWKDGKFTFSQLATQREDSVYGLMRGETPLKDLIGVPQ